MRQKHEQILAVLKLLETGPKTLKDISVAMNETKDCVRLWMCEIEHMGAVRSTFQSNAYRGNKMRIIHLVDKSKYKMKERKPSAWKTKEIYEASNYPVPTGGTIHRFLDQPERPRPLRKMNYAWQGYQSGLEAAS
jgi:hypothetical protein